MAELSVSILTSYKDERLGEIFEMLGEGGASYIHMDVMDGQFVPTRTFGSQFIKKAAELTPLPFDIHLMVEDPKSFVGDFLTANTKYITVHSEAVVDLPGSIKAIKTLGVSSGVAINPETPVSDIEHVLSDIDQVLVMSVVPGYAGQAFIDSSLEKVSRLYHLREKHSLDFAINIDGGINLSNIKKVLAAGADMYVSGSAILSADDPAYVLDQFNQIAGGS